LGGVLEGSRGVQGVRNNTFSESKAKAESGSQSGFQPKSRGKAGLKMSDNCDYVN
jgi:hypothetical protein